MLCDDSFISACLDVTTQDYAVTTRFFGVSQAVNYILDVDASIWTKTIHLDLCDRPSLSTLLDFIKLLQELSPTRLSDLGASSEIPFHPYLSIPRHICLNQCTLSLRYSLSIYGSAFDVLCRRGKGFSDKCVAAIISRAISCISNLHTNGLLHRNLCAQHLLIRHRHNATSELEIVLCGLGSMVQLPPSWCSVARNDLPILHVAWRGWKIQSSPYSHPVAWYSPEMMAQDFTGYSFPSDIYSIGLTIYELFTGTSPYYGLPPSLIFLKKMVKEDKPDLNQGSTDYNPSPEMMEIYEACTRNDPAERPSAKELLQMPWIQYGLSIDFKSDLLQS